MPSSHRLARPLPLAVLLLAACSASSSDGPEPIFPVRTTEVAVASTAPIVVRGNWIAFLCDEAASDNTDFNGDTDSVDQIAYVVNAVSRVETNLAVAARELAWAGKTLFLVVDEAFDERDWGGAPGETERVLLRWTAPQGPLQFVDVLAPGATRSLVSVGQLLFYASADTPGGALETSLKVIHADDPGDPHGVSSDDLVGGLRPRILDEQGGIVLLALNETVEGRDLNGDGDPTDAFVLALLDAEGELVGPGYSHDLANTALALPSASSPLRALQIGAGERAVAFLVDEAAQGNTNLNLFDGNTLPASWYPPHCPGVGDADTLDEVLHYVLFDAWRQNPGLNPPVNTGICGADRILMGANAVGTLSPEADEGTCSLNGDVDQLDTVFRWIRFGQPPIVDVELLLAVDTALAGPAQGVGELSDRFVIQVDEAADGRDWDGQVGVVRKLFGWVGTGSQAPDWTFDHDPNPGVTRFVTATWVGETPNRTRLGTAFAESSNNEFLNHDDDKLDSVPTFARIDTSAGARLLFPGIAFATPKENAGIEVLNGWGFYRISEAEDDRDWNGDDDKGDTVLLATNLSSGQTVFLGSLNVLQRRAVEGQPDGGGGAVAFLVSEAFTGDLNGDTDTLDFIVRYTAF